MKLAKNLKNLRPAYAVKLGEGKFVGTLFMCNKCGKQYTTTLSFPGPGAGGKCPDTSSGQHVWVKC